MDLDNTEIEHLESLVRITLSAVDIDTLKDQLPKILEQFELLNEVDTSDISPTGHAVNVESVMRQDELRTPLSTDEVLSNVPNVLGDHIRVKTVLEE